MVLKKSFFIHTFGCRLNQAESAKMTRQLLNIGFNKVNNWQKADLVIVNTCTVTHKADREVRQLLRRIKRENPNCLLVAVGCFVNRIRNNESRIKNNELNKIVDLWVSNEDKCNVKKWLPKVFFSNLSPKIYHLKPKIDKYHQSGKALIKIQNGCDNFCSYCIVPYVRGRSRSVPADEIINQIKKEVEEGIREVVLTGIDLGSYQFKVKSEKLKIKVNSLKLLRIKNHLVKLICLILSETKIEKISFGSMSLKVFDKDFFTFYQQFNNLTIEQCLSRLSTHFHIPLQSGSDSVLKRMRRRYNSRQAIKVIKDIKEKIPNASLSTDIIVGFPGETRAEFRQTVDLLKKIKKILGRYFCKIHVFRYSARAGTCTAAMMKVGKWQQMTAEISKRRAKAISRF